MQPIEDVEVQVSIPAKRYRTNDGEPTCARSFQSGDACPFVATFPFVLNGICGLVTSTTDKQLPGDIALVDPGESGFLVPHKDCPLWSNAQ